MLFLKKEEMQKREMKKWFGIKILLAVFLLCSASGFAIAQDAIDGKNIEDLQNAVAKDPNKLALHEDYIAASLKGSKDEKISAKLLEQYKVWMKSYPNSATVPFAIGHALKDEQDSRAKKYLLKAVKIDPNFGEAYYDLWNYSELRGEFALARDYMLKAKEASPDNPEYNFYYAFTFRNVDFDKYQKLSLAVADKFPNTERAAQSLYWLGYETENEANKLSIFERLRTEYPPKNFRWSSSAMQAYFSEMVTKTPKQALIFADEMLRVPSKHIQKEEWQLNKAFATEVVKIDSFLTVGKTHEAIQVSSVLKAPEYYNLEDFVVELKNRVLFEDGKNAEAYANLVEIVAKKPTKSFEHALTIYGKAAGKSASQMKAQVVAFRDSTAKQAPEFNLENYLTKKRTRLSDYRGKVVLLTYWFPGCGPCRREFPFFEKVVKQFPAENLAYVGINIVPDQDNQVLPFLAGSGYSFIPLKDNKDWTKGPLENNNAAPFNVLMDQDGKIIFSGFTIDRGNEELLHTMIKSLLERNKTSS